MKTCLLEMNLKTMNLHCRLSPFLNPSNVSKLLNGSNKALGRGCLQPDWEGCLTDHCILGAYCAVLASNKRADVEGEGTLTFLTFYQSFLMHSR